MINLIRYEFKKYFSEFKWYVLASVLLGLIFVVINAVTKTDGEDLIGSISFVLCIGTIINLLLAPVIQAIFIYGRDLNKNYAVMESSMPYTGIEKFGSKLIVGVSYVIFTGLLAIGIANLLLNFTSLRHYADNINMVLDNNRYLLKNIIQNNPRYILSYIVKTVYLAVSALITIGFFITLHSVLRHKIKGAVPVTIFIGLLYSVIDSFIMDYLGKIGFSIQQLNLNITLPDIIGFLMTVAAFFAVTYMLDKKTELA